MINTFPIEKIMSEPNCKICAMQEVTQDLIAQSVP